MDRGASLGGIPGPAEAPNVELGLWAGTFATRLLITTFKTDTENAQKEALDGSWQTPKPVVVEAPLTLSRSTVRRDDGDIFRRSDAMLIRDYIERRFELPGVLVHGEFLHHSIIHHERQAVDEPLYTLGNRRSFRTRVWSRHDQRSTFRAAFNRIPAETSRP